MARQCFLLLITFIALVNGQVPNNRQPTFNSSNLIVQVTEEQPAGAFVTRIYATDPENDTIRYSLVGGTNFFFTLDPFTGNITFARTLDREALTPNNEPLQITVEATDDIEHGVPNSRVLINIYLIDINDNVPQPNLPRNVSFVETTSIGTVLFQVTANDSDAGQNSQLLYFIIAVDGQPCNVSQPSSICSMFSIGVSNGVLGLQRSLDYENSREHRILITVEDRGAIPNVAIPQILTLVVTDFNDQNPTFDLEDYFAEVHENLTMGDVVIQVNAYDQDLGINDAVEYQIISGNLKIDGNDTFAINIDTGSIFVNIISLDREIHQEYQLTVMASEVNDSTKTDTTRVSITVFDINDHAPVFLQSQYSTNISETLVLESDVITVTAVDRDTGVHAEFQFTLVNLKNSSMPLPFRIDHDVNSGVGTIVLSDSLDFEQITEYVFQVIATETIDNMPQNGSTLVTVTILNENDNTPEFSNSSYLAVIPENISPGSYVITVFATDNDFGSFGQVQYSFQSETPSFNISSTAGDVITSLPLDYEVQPEYILTVIASDFDKPETIRRGIATLTVLLENLNDNPPRFTDDGVVITMIEVIVPEELSASFIAYTFEVEDLDMDLNELTFEIVGGNTLGHFEIDGDELRTTVPLDYDLGIRSYNLRIMVNDSEHVDFLNLTIQVLDINDNNPVFDNSTYSLTILENQPIETEVGDVFASDIDSGTFGEIVYTLRGLGSESFSINSTTGVISTAVELNREIRQLPFNLEVTATDQDESILDRRSATVPVTITVLDENDNSPVFTESTYIFNVNENNRTFEFRVLASDMDIGSNQEITYHILDGNMEEIFIINEYTGVISKNSSEISLELDRERVSQYTLNVTARDGGERPNYSFVPVIININDVNDVTPTFSSEEYNATIREDININSIVTDEVVATDDDTGDFGLVSYTILSQSGPTGANAPSGRFLVSSTTGVIRTTGSFDREAFPGPYILTIRGADGGNPGNSATATLSVFIEDANDNRPVFSNALYRRIVDENQETGVSVVQVSATDADEMGTPNADIEYAICDDLGQCGLTALNAFYIDSMTGVIYTNTTLDYESIQSYRITVVASDMGEPQRSSNAFVDVTVRDVNDHSPILSEDTYILNITEDTSVNTRYSNILATDSDSGTNAQITYGSSISSPFRIDPVNGNLILVNSLNYETETSYMFNVSATDDGGFVDYAEVIVNVVDVNDHSPIFEQIMYTVEIEEGDYSSNGIPILNLTATDEDSENLGSVSFEIFPAHSQFSISSISGRYGLISAVGVLDRETTDFYRLTVIARDGDGTPRTATTTVDVTILDVNDNTPIMDRSIYTAVVQENSTPGEAVAIVRATDEDLGTNAVILFSILNVNDIGGEAELMMDVDFAIDELTGIITTLTSFDYEESQGYNLTIVARDNSTTARLSSTAFFLVTISDVNDNAPFISAFPLDDEISEDTDVGYEVGKVTAVDIDSGDNGDILFQLSNDEGKFAISTSGVITLINSLDREVASEHNLTVTISDRGQPQMSVTEYLFINVTDINDVVPVFLSDTYSFLISEDVPANTTVGRVFADDMDLGTNGLIVFSLVGGSTTQFRIETESISGPPQVQRYVAYIINNIPFDYELETSYSLQIQANNSPFVVSTNVTVSVRDINDNKPRFSLPDGYVLSISESAPVTAPVGTLVATDNDGGLNGTVTYSFSPNSTTLVTSTFSIDSVSGIISLAATLNFESIMAYNLVVIATDSAAVSARLSTSVNVTVNVLNFNEEAPVFTQQIYFGALDENLSAGANIVTVNATEGDGDTITYSLAAGNATKFAVDSVSGQISTKVPLDREEQSRYVLTIQATDSPDDTALASFVQVEVTVNDINDNNPVFSRDTYEFSIRENSPIGETLAIVTATDADLGTNALITYSLTTGLNEFRVNSATGEITVANPSVLDREVTPTLTIRITARDNGATPRASTATITVTLTNINDFSPVFLNTPYRLSVPENSAAGVSILTVRATDGDGDTVSYSIISGDDQAPNNKFIINSNTGLIETSANPLDRESLADQDYTYTLSIQGTDNGDRDGDVSRSAVVPVVITITDINDISPQCPTIPYMFTVPEANDNDLRIGQIETTDGDSGVNAVVNYRIDGGDLNGQFRITPTSGDLFANPGLDFETTPVYNLRVAAIDQALNPADRMTSTCIVTVTLIDENDNRPVFTSDNYEASVSENTSVGIDVIQVSANDQDSGVNGMITYSFQTALREFSIDSQTGIITVSGSLDSETRNSYLLDVEAADQGTPTRVGITQVTIRVININDNSPRFDRSFYVTEASEATGANVLIITVTAQDLDSDSLSYSISGGNNLTYFKVDSDTGQIQTARSLDREQESLFNLLITARDEDGNSGTTRLQIIITDVNDESPRFLQPSYSARIPENSPAGTQIIPEYNATTPIRIQAIDADQPNTLNSRVLYSLSGDNAGLFDINFSTGIISVARGVVLDYDNFTEVNVTVVARDSGPNTQSSSVLLTVHLIDENDNAPVFSQRFGYVVQIEENLPIDVVVVDTIRATDVDTGRGGVVMYSLTNASPLPALNSFIINSTTGDLSASLDREAFSNVTLLVAAADQGSPSLSSVVTVIVFVLDVNDNPPRFSQDVYTASVPEGSSISIPVLRVLAEDPDEGSNGAVTYSLITTNEPFFITRLSGEIFATTPLDHETTSSYSITVRACDIASPMMCSTSIVVIAVQDTNDESPIFDIPSYTVDICETAAAGSAVVRPVATDRDSDINARLTYTLENSALFIVNNATGLISLLRPIDELDVTNGEYRFTIVATDGGRPPLSGQAEVVVRILNCTEHLFYFNRSYNYFEIREGENQFTDGRTAQVLQSNIIPLSSSLSTFAQNPFNLNLNLLNLKPSAELLALNIGQKSGLDREVRDLYTVIVRGERNGFVSYTSITLQVLDTNDNGPVFTSDLYVFDIAENDSSVVDVGFVLAEDRDEGINSQVSYVLQGISPASSKNPFEVNISTGGITRTRELDRETVSRYNLTVQATDGVNQSSTQVLINILDINDCIPKFSQPSYNAQVAENLPAGVSVTTVMASDCDVGNNATVRYAVIGGDLAVFDLDFVSGEITTLNILDFETIPSYRLEVEARDMGNPTLSNEVIVNIQVVDFNDCPPEFIDPPSSVTILENATIGSVLVNYSVRDCDSGVNGVEGAIYTIIAGNEDRRFEIRNGVLFSGGSLDRELNENYLLSIQVTDGATTNRLSSVTTLTILVGDVNDNEPVFVDSDITVTVDEGEDLNQALVQIRAVDDDSGINGQITYSLLNDEGVFSIDATTGVLTLISTLDRDTDPPTTGYELTVIARDRAIEPRSSNATISVTITDDNDNAPVIHNITSGVTTVSVEEDLANGTAIFVVMATDIDEGTNSDITYFLDDRNLPFSISPSGGVIFKDSYIDYELRTEYILVITAVDGGSPRQTSTVARLIVNVLDVNDNAPKFSEDLFEGSQIENTQPSMSILTVQATDMDQGESAIIEYSIISGNEDNYFFIDPQSGVIFNQVALNRETIPLHTLTVLANNSMSRIELFDTAQVRITVIDDNDEYPQFVESIYQMILNESTPSNEFVIQVNAFDTDQPGNPNSDIIYSINVSTNMGNVFYIDPDTGRVTLQNSLDHETQSSFNLSVIAEDKGSVPLRNTTTIYIDVTDTNDNGPMFTEESYTLTVNEGVSTFPQTIQNLEYMDVDSTEIFKLSTFSISTRASNDELSQLFRVDTDSDVYTGRLSLIGSLDYEITTRYDIILAVANDLPNICPNGQHCPTNLRSTARATILIEDANDNSPVFEQDMYNGEISTTSPPDSSVLSVLATDADRSPKFSTVKYRLEGDAASDGKFRVDENRGTIFTRGRFDEDTSLSYVLTVIAYDNDGANPSLEDSAMIKLVVLNDFQRVAIIFRTSVDVIVKKERFIKELLENITGLNVVIENYASYSNLTHTQFIFHSMDSNNRILSFNEFLQHVGNNYSLIFERLKDCNITEITSFAILMEYEVPSLLDRETIVILVFCLLLIFGALVLLAMALRQRFVGWTQESLKADALASNQLFAPSGLEEQGHYLTHDHQGEQYELLEKGNFLNPMYVVPTGMGGDVDTSVAGSTGLSSMHKNNPLYESQEISMDMFKDADYDDEDEDEDYGAEALQAVIEDEDEMFQGGDEESEDDIERTMI